MTCCPAPHFGYTTCMRIHWRYVAAAVVLAMLAFVVSLWAFPAWAGSVRWLVALAVAAVVGVVAFLASARQAFEKQPPPESKPSEPSQTQITETQIQSTGVEMREQATVIGNVAGRDNVTVNIQPPPPTFSALYQLPSPPADFTGREAELNELREKITQGGAIISGLHGLGGVGKTALALKLADELKSHYPDAQFYLDLGGVSESPLSPADALSRIIHAFQPKAKLPESADELRPIFLSLLHDKKALLLMDNAKDAEQVKPLIPSAACLLLVTSRQHFRLPGLFLKGIDTLPPDEARELLVKIAPRLAPMPLTPGPSPSRRGERDSLSLWERAGVREKTPADEIAALCGCLPLALCAAGSLLAVTPDLSPETYIAGLRDERTRLERIGKEGVDISVEASLNLSYRQLPEEAAQVLRCLSVFPATFDAAAEEVICEDPEHEQLSELVKRSLVKYLPSPAGTAPAGGGSRVGSIGRYSLHDLVRVFANGKLADDEHYVAQKRHALFYADVIGKAQQLYDKGSDSMMVGLSLFDSERQNIEVGQAWSAAHVEANDDAAKACNWYAWQWSALSLRLHPRENVRWLDAALSASRVIKNREAEGAHLGNLGLAYADLGDARKAIEYYEQQLKIVREIGDRRGEGNALGNLGSAQHALGDVRKALEYYEQQLKMAREIGDRRGEGAALGNLGSAQHALGDVRKAIEYHKQALVINREIGDRRGEGNALGNLGNTYATLGDARKAIEYYEKRMVIAREIGDRRGEGNALGNLGSAHYALGDARKAIEYHEQQLKIVREIGDRHVEGNALGNLGTAYAALGDARKAIEYYEKRIVIAREIGDRRGEGNALFNMSLALNDLDEREKAIAHAEAALKIYEQIESPYAERVRQQLAEWRSKR